MSNPDINVVQRRRSPVPLSQCGLAFAANKLGDRWSLLILREAFYGVRRFDDLQTDLSIPRQALSDRLSRLVALGLLIRAPYRDDGKRERYEYQLTKSAIALIPSLMALMNWGAETSGIELPISVIRRDTGAAIRLAVLDESGGDVPLDQVSLVVK